MKKKKPMVQTKNGRKIDANRIITKDGVKKILLGVAWVTTQEKWMFEHYPDIIGCDTKAKINEFKSKCLGFVGKDPNNGIFTICRMYMSIRGDINQTNSKTVKIGVVTEFFGSRTQKFWLVTRLLFVLGS